MVTKGVNRDDELVDLYQPMASLVWISKVRTVTIMLTEHGDVVFRLLVLIGNMRRGQWHMERQS